MQHALATYEHTVASLSKQQERDLARGAFVFANHIHDWVLRQTGDPYMLHSLDVANNLYEHFHDFELFVAGILHDVAEDGPAEALSQIYDQFGPKIWFLVDSVSKNTRHYFQETIEYSDKIEKLLAGGMRDVRCLLLKIADRDNNLRTIEALKEHKQVRIGFETQAIYQPLKNALCYDKAKTIEDARACFWSFLKENTITDPVRLKSVLLGTFFFDFDNEMFDLVYKNSSCINWSIDDKEMYRTLVSHPHFDKSIEVMSLSQSSDGEFRCSFRYHSGHMFHNLDAQFQIESYHW